MKVAVTVTVCRHVGFEHSMFMSKTRVFETTYCIVEILDWAKSIFKEANWNNIKFTNLED